MTKFRMVDIIPLLPIPNPQGGRSSYYVPCPCCDDKSARNGHLNINLVKNVFRCPRCGFSGGVLGLYAHYANMSTGEARDAIASRLGVNVQAYDSKRKNTAWKVPQIKEFPIADIETRNATYNALLSKLTLASDHMANLIGRGLTERIIAEKQYRTSPVAGWRTLARQLHEDGLYLSGVPGFYRDADGQWAFAEIRRGMLIPVRDLHGRIQGLQVRRDNATRRKFRWISSSERQDGCKAAGWTHLAGGVHEEILLIEGPMKADIVNFLTDKTVLSIPGVNSLTQLEASLIELMALGVKRIMTCFDMDMLKNPHIQKAYSALLWMLDGMGLEFGTYLWEPSYNGLDDYVWKWCCGR